MHATFSRCGAVAVAAFPVCREDQMKQVSNESPHDHSLSHGAVFAGVCAPNAVSMPERENSYR